MNCPCCRGKLLAHYSSKGRYWYCLFCRQVMPIIKPDNRKKIPS